MVTAGVEVGTAGSRDRPGRAPPRPEAGRRARDNRPIASNRRTIVRSPADPRPSGEPCVACHRRRQGGRVLWPLVVYFVLVIALAVALLALSALLGERHSERATALPYESGIVSTGSARLRFGAAFYLVAVFFVIFDLEAAYIFSWAVALRALGWAAYAEGLVFIGILSVALAWVWRVGGLDLAPRSRLR
ncbi:MAG: NADH-quinone oxidoreductase subunit A [Acidobacteria bacterium]|nr:NADH-quinone oxidoreductase subunit A [Acidobacteriota bacterium]